MSVALTFLDERASHMPTQHRFITRPLFMQVRDALANRIAMGEWKAGEFLPNEITIAKELDVSQGTVRKAMEVLEVEKILVRQQGRGTQVINHDTEEMAIRFSSIFNDRGQRISGHSASCQVIERLIDEEEALALLAPKTELVFEVSRVRNYHDHAFMVEKSILVARLFPKADKRLIADVRLTTIAQKCGVQLSHATEQVIPVLPSPEIASTLGVANEQPVLHLIRTTFSLRDERVEYRRSWCHLREKKYVSVTR